MTTTNKLEDIFYERIQVGDTQISFSVEGVTDEN